MTPYVSEPGPAGKRQRSNDGRELSVGEQIRQSTVQANGMTFATLEAGEGPLVVLLHGFPDNAWTWELQLVSLARAGYRAVAPFLRGYPPSDVPSVPFDTEDVTNDIPALIAALGERSAAVVGHDWGGLALMHAAAMYPDVITRAVSIGVGHPRTVVNIFRSPEQLHYAFHVWLLQMDVFAEPALSANDFALVDYLWRHWSSRAPDSTHLQRVKKTLREPGVAEALLGYYRGLVRVPSEKPQFFARATQNINVPMLVVFGEDDAARVISEGERPFFDGEYRREIVARAGHFVHREQPEQLTRLLLEHLCVSA
jgi:pimeloyl-ACP methyl ester carboxylesterase